MLISVGSCSSGDAGLPTTASSTSVSSSKGGGEPCPSEVDAASFPAADDLRELLADYNEFGLRSPGSESHEAALNWLIAQFEAIPTMTVRTDEFTIDRWQPTIASTDGPGRDLARSGELALIEPGAGTDRTVDVAVVGAVPFSLPTPEDGVVAPLVFFPADRELTPAEAAGRIVVREIPHSSLPFAAFGVVGHHLTPDVPTDGDYDRPYLRNLDALLNEAGSVGAAGLIMVWDAPTDQLRGYWDPHTGARFETPSVFVGSDTFPAILAAAERGGSARLAVHAKWDKVTTRNLVATLPGRTRERIVVSTNTDSVNWVQENGTVAALALARYLAGLPLRCRERDVEFGLTSNHLGLLQDGVIAYSDQLDRDYQDGTVAFVMVPEHLGTREILPGLDGRLAYTGEGEVFAWSAPAESPVLVEASVKAVRRRRLTRTAVLQGVGVPNDEQVPSICSQGGLGTPFHSHLIPTVAGISGPWSLWAPGFGEGAIDFDRFRDQLLAFGDLAVQLDDVSLDEIAGTYPEARRRRSEGAVTCPEG